jgi:hypothetical protein
MLQLGYEPYDVEVHRLFLIDIVTFLGKDHMPRYWTFRRETPPPLPATPESPRWEDEWVEDDIAS